MLARVKPKHSQSVINAFEGREYIKAEWRVIPPGKEKEARLHPFLDVKMESDSEVEPDLLAEESTKQEEAKIQEEGSKEETDPESEPEEVKEEGSKKSPRSRKGG